MTTFVLGTLVYITLLLYYPGPMYALIIPVDLSFCMVHICGPRILVEPKKVMGHASPIAVPQVKQLPPLIPILSTTFPRTPHEILESEYIPRYPVIEDTFGQTVRHLGLHAG